MRIEFNASERASLGIEVELEIVDSDSRELRSGASELIGSLPDQNQLPKAKHELFESTVEIITGVCTTVAEARADLEATLARLDDAARQRDMALLCSGSHPFSDWAAQEVSPHPRYARLMDEMQWMARRLQIFGIHVHVGVRSGEKAIAIANGLTAYIPHFLALSASSPYWMGRDTGLASSRSKVFEGLPTAGLPYQLADWDEFEQFMETLVSARAIQSIREVWWDIRPHPDFGTVELRICDGIPTMSEIAAVAALSQCLVQWMDEELDAGAPPPVPRQWIVRQNKWRAARHGVDAEIIDPVSRELVRVDDALRGLVERLHPVADRLGCRPELDHTLAVLDHGPSYLRQRAVVAAGGSLADVVDTLVAELRTDRPTGTE